MKIDTNTTLKIAKLCRIRIEDHETEELTSQLSSILEWVEQLNEVNTENLEPLSNVSTAKLPLRIDKENSEDKSFNKEINQEKDPVIFENTTTEENTEVKEQEMFKEDNLEEDFEIPAFLRRQKN